MVVLRQGVLAGSRNKTLISESGAGQANEKTERFRMQALRLHLVKRPKLPCIPPGNRKGFMFIQDAAIRENPGSGSAE